MPRLANDEPAIDRLAGPDYDNGVARFQLFVDLIREGAIEVSGHSILPGAHAEAIEHGDQLAGQIHVRLGVADEDLGGRRGLD